jgi:helicase
MRPSLARWIGDADALRHLEHFRVSQATTDFVHIRSRADDYYLSLVGELFDRMREGYTDATQWARLGNALALFADDREDHLRAVGVSASDAALFGAAAFYCGGYPASAYLTIKERPPAPSSTDEAQLACFDLLARPGNVRSRLVRALLAALRRGQMETMDQAATRVANAAEAALLVGPTEWIPARVLQQLLGRFRQTNIRAVLPDGHSEFWNPLVSSLLNRKPPTWEFFPSQIEAIRRGLLERSESFSLQMPTGSGKTALCETLLYWHLQRNVADAAILLVPYRSLASELRGTLVKRLNSMGLSARCAYGGTVPSGDEVRELDDTRAMVATPEAISGLLSADASFFRRISLVVCDEGHLLDGGGRGVGLELLLARMRTREGGAPRFIFVSAIVPNIEEINAWLGGNVDSVVRSDYRPALAEFAVLRASGTGAGSTIDLDMHPHESSPTRFSIAGFLRREDFHWTNPETGRRNTYGFASVKTQAIAAARKALAMGAAAVFAANKRGDQGAVGLAEELLDQLRYKMALPEPATFVTAAKVNVAVEYLQLEYGPAWVGTQTLTAGAVLHHGDIPQETREVVETLLRQGDVRLAICTNTLAEGVNLPIRTLVLYSVQRRQKGGRAVNMLSRDIKNLVGRAGRAGATTKGLVICANEQQWPLVEQVARQAPGEPVTGALRALVENLRRALAAQSVTLTNPILEEEPELHTLIDGIDATLIDLAAEEVGEDALVQLAIRLADQTFASQQADAVSKKLLQDVFELRARRVVGIRSAGRLGWIRETGTRARILDAVETGLLPRRSTWDDLTDPIDPAFVGLVLDWAWAQVDLQQAARNAYRLDDGVDVGTVRQTFFDAVAAWLSGARFKEISTRSTLPIDDLLGVHASVVSFVLQTLVEQGVALLAKLLESQGHTVAPAVLQFPEHLRFGVPTAAARVLAAGGVRHRSAAVELGTALASQGMMGDDRMALFSAARRSILAHRDALTTRLGALVVENTLWDISGATGEEPDESEES